MGIDGSLEFAIDLQFPPNGPLRMLQATSLKIGLEVEIMVQVGSGSTKRLLTLSSKS